jgi:glycosyltransferase involved in cell wall biosynthesis
VCKRRSEERVMRRAREAGVHRIESLALASGVAPLADARDVRRLMAWLPEAGVLHVHRGKEHWLAALANRLARARRPLVRTRHIVQPVRPHALNRWLYRHATDHVVTVTDAIRRQLVAAGLVDALRVTALPGGVDATRFRPTAADAGGLRERLGVAVETPIVGLVSGFRVMKGHRTVVEAAARLAAAGRRFHLLLVGQGPFEAPVREQIEAAGLGDRVTVLGFLDDLPATMAGIDVALYSALESDGMSRVLFEYLGAGVPVVASRVGVVPEILEDGVTGMLVPAGEPEPLARAIARLLEDTSLRRRIGDAGRGLVEARYSGARLAERLIALYRSPSGQAPACQAPS